ncbi:mucin-2-like isoform X2 [Daphnia carinata]|uniref:mucin-2-like isoform X2 n=1 Tax=Daphnia carinata TaxID=120202 RepID=UPI00257FF6B9|nr:mucin-2-like isoform X2 [Daphnia carinata]
MTATIGVTFGAGSAAKRILLFAINVTVLLLGVTCSVLCLYQVKLMPETYDVIVAAVLESNLTTAVPVLPPAVVVIDIRNNNNNKNGRNTTRPGSNKGRPRVTPKKGNTTNQHTPVSPVTFMKNITSLIETGSTSSMEVQRLDFTKTVALSQTGTTASFTTSSMMAKSSVTSSHTTTTQVVTSTSLMNTMKETIDFGQVLKNRIAELENELRLAQLREKVDKSIEQENKMITTLSSMISSPIGEFNFSDTQSSPLPFAITSASWPSSSISTPAPQQLTMTTQTWPISTTEKYSSYPASLISTSSLTNAVSSTTTTLSPTSQQTFATTSIVKPDGTMPTMTPSNTSTVSSTPASTITSLLSTTSSATTRFQSRPIVSVATSTTFKASQTSTSSTSSAPTPGKTSILTSATKMTSTASATPARIVTKIPKTTFALTSATSNEVPSTKTSTRETSTAGEISITSAMPPAEASLSTVSQTTSQEQVSSTLIKAIINHTPSTTSSLSSPMQPATPLTTLLMATSLSSSVSTERTSPSFSETTTTNRPLTTTNATSPIGSSTKSISTSTTTPSSLGFINLTNVVDTISKWVGRRDLSKHRLYKRSSVSTVPPAVHSADTLTADHIPIYFEQVFFFVQTSLYVCTAAGLLIFFSSLVGICGGLFRIDGCLKFSVAALVLVIMAEMATTAFIFVAHDKASNRNKNKNFDRDLKLLCDLANFCIQPMLLVITGSFLCISVVLQIGSITLACNLMDNRSATDPDKKLRRMMRSSHSNFQFGAGNAQMNPYSNPMPMPCCGGGGYGGMNSNLFPYSSPMTMPMQNMGYYPPVFSVPGQRPIVNIIS